jgi:galactokinase
MQHLDAMRDELGALIYKRCRYVVGEIARVNQAVDAMDKGDFATLGKLMYQTHDGLSHDYEVSCPELDFLVDFARKDGVPGSRMMGGGFGGCSINLIRKGSEDDFVARLAPAYRDAFGIELKTYRVKISDGTKVCEQSTAPQDLKGFKNL